MKTFIYKTLALALSTCLLTSCDQDTEAEVKPLGSTNTAYFGTVPGTTIIDFSENTGFIDHVMVVKDSYTTLPVKITAKQYTNGRPVAGNAALVFDTRKPDGQHSGYKAVNEGPFQLGNVLTIGQTQGRNNTLYDKGGSIEMDFSSFGSIVMRGLYVADIDASEKGSTLEMLNAAGEVIYEMELPVTGAYTFQPIMFGDGVAGVVKLRVTFKSRNGMGGSGAIDVIQFCPGSVCYN
ncbi:MAG TPA: hypothetical protein VIG72_02650 [Pontibacter sp.]